MTVNLIAKSLHYDNNCVFIVKIIYFRCRIISVFDDMSFLSENFTHSYPSYPFFNVFHKIFIAFICERFIRKTLQCNFRETHLVKCERVKIIVGGHREK